MRLLMVSGDRQVVAGEKGPFFWMQREFSKHFERIDVLVPRPARPAAVLTIHERVHFHPSPLPRSRAAKWIAKKGAELLSEHGHSLIVSHDYGWFRNGVGAAALSKASGVPYVSEIHHVPGVPIATGWRERFERTLARRYVRWAKGRAAAFRVVNSGEMAPLLESWGVPREKILVLPSLYIDLEVFKPDAPGASSNGFDQDVVFVGRMVENKGLDRIVDALAALRAKGEPRTALFVGKGPMLEPTRARAKKNLGDAARFIEWVESPSDLARIYRRSRLAVCASSCEGGPRVTVEAMACGTPVVSTKVGVMGELLANGRCGRLADFTAPGLARAIGEVLADEKARRQMGEAARAIAARYEYAKTIRNYAEGLKSLAEGAE
ncbi:MAG: glycosyltransferase family 4 protein [Planctomycetota bacterium]